jgi:aminoglycoside phosphotransferase (APT) family kinase protein
MADDRADFDNVAWDRNDEAWEESQKVFRRFSTLRKVESFVTEKFRKAATWVTPFKVGGYNNLYRMKIEGSDEDVLIRLPQPNLAQFPEEKTVREAATASFILHNTRVPVPRVLFHGLSIPDSELGPYIIMQYVENHRSMSHALAVPNEKDPNEAHMLNPDVSDDVLEEFYSKVAVYLQQLFEPSFPRIGSLNQSEKNIYSVGGRPLTQNMNNMVQLANIPRDALPPEEKTYRTADDWYVALAEMHMAQLVFQHNDLVTTEDDCRNKYVARRLFYKLARQRRLSTFGFREDDWSAQSKTQQSTLAAPSGTSSFRLWCDDLRPSNVLLNEADDIVAVIDWEFAYVAPTQFALDPPWWLLLNVPEMWHTNIDDWAKIYDVRLKTWLRAIEKAEESIETKSKEFKLSIYMRESWETGRFWLNYAARKSWAFDTIFWKYLDQRFFGSKEGEGKIPMQDLWRTRIHLLSERERSAMESFVERKMEESKERILIDWNDKQVKERLGEVLFEDNLEEEGLKNFEVLSLN